MSENKSDTMQVASEAQGNLVLQLKAALEENAKLKAELAANDRGQQDAFDTQLGALQRERDQLVWDVHELNKRISDLDHDRNQMSVEILAYQTEVRKLSNERDVLFSTKTDEENEIDTLTRERDAAWSEVTRLSAQLEQAQVACDYYKNEHKSYQARWDSDAQARKDNEATLTKACEIANELSAQLRGAQAHIELLSYRLIKMMDTKEADK